MLMYRTIAEANFAKNVRAESRRYSRSATPMTAQWVMATKQSFAKTYEMDSIIPSSRVDPINEGEFKCASTVGEIRNPGTQEGGTPDGIVSPLGIGP